jgi:DNA repair/transcription protein MET18/MMS19
VVPHLVTLFRNPDEISSRQPILLLLADVVNATRDVVGKGVKDTENASLGPYKDDILGIISTGLKSPATYLAALSVTIGLTGTKNLLTDEEIGFVVHLMNEVFGAKDMEHDDLGYFDCPIPRKRQ